MRAKRRYGRYVRVTRTGRPVIDAGAVKAVERLDGKFVVHSNDDSLSAADMALGYKQLQRVEQAWRCPRHWRRICQGIHRFVNTTWDAGQVRSRPAPIARIRLSSREA